MPTTIEKKTEVRKIEVLVLKSFVVLIATGWLGGFGWWWVQDTFFSDRTFAKTFDYEMCESGAFVVVYFLAIKSAVCLTRVLAFFVTHSPALRLLDRKKA